MSSPQPPPERRATREIVARLLARRGPAPGPVSPPPAVTWGPLHPALQAVLADPRTTLREREALAHFQAGLEPDPAAAEYFYFIVEE